MLWLALPIGLVSLLGATTVASAGALLLLGRRDVTGAYDAIVVYGCRVRPDGRPTAALERRTRHAVSLYQRGVAPQLVFSGCSRGGLPSEAHTAADLAIELGVPREAVSREPHARNTWENAKRCAELLPDARVVIVTEAFHMVRSLYISRAHFRQVHGSSAPTPPRSAWRYALRELPSWGLVFVPRLRQR